MTANFAVGTLFAWSLVAQDAAAGAGMSRDAAAAVFAGAIVVCTAVAPAADIVAELSEMVDVL